MPATEGAVKAAAQTRTITDEHRLVYKVEADTLTIIACKYHYG